MKKVSTTVYAYFLAAIAIVGLIVLAAMHVAAPTILQYIAGGAVTGALGLSSPLADTLPSVIAQTPAPAVQPAPVASGANQAQAASQGATGGAQAPA